MCLLAAPPCERAPCQRAACPAVACPAPLRQCTSSHTSLTPLLLPRGSALQALRQAPAHCCSLVLLSCAVRRRSRLLHGLRRPWRVPDAAAGAAQVSRPGDGEAGGALCFGAGALAAPAGMRVKHLPPLALDAACPPDYPAAAPPVAALSAPWLSARAAAALEAGLAAVWAEQGPGAPVGFTWASWLAAEALGTLGVADTLTLPARGPPAGPGAHDPTPHRELAALADPTPSGSPARAPSARAPAGNPSQSDGRDQHTGAAASDAAAGAASASGGPGPPGCSAPASAARGTAMAEEPAGVSVCVAKSREGALRACDPGGGGQRTELQPYRRPRGRGTSMGGGGGDSVGGDSVGGGGMRAARATSAAAPTPGRAPSASPHRAPGQAGLRASAAAFTPGAALPARDCNGSAGAGGGTAAPMGRASPAAGSRPSPAAARSGGRTGGSGGAGSWAAGRDPVGRGSRAALAGSGSASAEPPVLGSAALAEGAGACGAGAESRTEGAQLGGVAPSTAPCEVPPCESGGEEGDAGRPAGGSDAGGDEAESAVEVALALLRYSAAREFQLWQEARRPCEHARGAGLCCMPRPSCAACGGAACAPAPRCIGRLMLERLQRCCVARPRPSETLTLDPLTCRAPARAACAWRRSQARAACGWRSKP